MGKIDPNHDIVPTLRMMGGLLFDKAADEIDLLREAYRAAVSGKQAQPIALADRVCVAFQQ